MSPHLRSLLIGMFGPALQAVGLLWVLLNAVIGSGRELTLRYLIFEPAHLVILVGILVSVVSIPVAIQVALAAPEEMEIPTFEPALEGEPTDVPADDTPPGTWETAD